MEGSWKGLRTGVPGSVGVEDGGVVGAGDEALGGEVEGVVEAGGGIGAVREERWFREAKMGISSRGVGAMQGRADRRGEGSRGRTEKAKRKTGKGKGRREEEEEQSVRRVRRCEARHECQGGFKGFKPPMCRYSFSVNRRSVYCCTKKGRR